MSHGPLMLDIAGFELTQLEREMLLHPVAGGVILFSRNFQSPQQIKTLVSEIHGLREPPLLIAVDQEGGRVQRFREGFSRLPPAAWFGELNKQNSKKAKSIAQKIGWLMAAELRSVGVDFSFAPVLDLGFGKSSVIGDRAFDRKPLVVAELAHAWMMGVHEAGMAAVGKHFPGHGWVSGDSHCELPIDHRRLGDIMMEDLLPFQRMIDYGMEAIMPAHVIYDHIDPKLAGFSKYWLQDVLRKQLNFQGVIFSDDLTMAAAEEAGGYAQRAHAALNAGCDMVLVCNNSAGASEVLEALGDYNNPAAQMRLIRMHGRKAQHREVLHMDPRWRESVELIALYEESPSLNLDL
ncbi:beta-N-acetylhexosaminidase [Sedimenticola selenatireducens]|uniref:Beta-hexosaminidase n=1 Tax=Sedimenticola selenatireducens TaxID=191960 RepID=A0A557RZF3_9GAMM|nr:beta-N-acetylhexosaminidase [Sedimenticola selenatireducens]TVO70508.1 beta-N-acetylhexosaminidase [Sedimenticola selenatireducens]TVT63085.1 MAG: beta-N-acetylhexosaminidase [Sedimenticola selenatireducens]